MLAGACVDTELVLGCTVRVFVLVSGVMDIVDGISELTGANTDERVIVG